MMKKMLCLLLTLTLLCAFAPAQAAQTPSPLTCDEVDAWAKELLAYAATQTPLNDPSAPEAMNEDGYVFEYPFGALHMSGPDLATAQLISVELIGGDVAAPHGATVYMFSQEVMALFAQTNADLVGTRQAAVIYEEGLLPQTLRWGIAYRDGQRLQTLEYAALEPTEGGFRFRGVSFALQENMVISIQVYGMNQVMDESTAQNLSALVDSASTAKTYRQVPSSYNGGELAMFDEEDLVFAGLNLTSLTPEMACLALGDARGDEWIRDVDGGYIRVMTFDTCEVTFACDENRENPKAETFCALTDTVEGPRALRLGDSLTSVRNRFRYGEGSFNEETMVETLYGENSAAPSGLADYSVDGVTVVYYLAPLDDGRTATLMLTFEQMYMTDLLLALQ